MELDFQKAPRILNRFVDHETDGVFTTDAKGTIAAWSAGAERITGHRSHTVVGKPCRILDGRGAVGFSSLMARLAHPASLPKGIWHQEFRIRCGDGHDLSLHGTLRMVTNAQDTLAGVIGLFIEPAPSRLSNGPPAGADEQAGGQEPYPYLVGRSPVMQEVVRRIRLAAETDATVLVTGESGTGKELAVRAIHTLSRRGTKPFLAINCAAIPDLLLESEMFGHVKGAFTGSVRDKVGMFQAAHGGTLFLDEVGDISPILQVKLLRVLQEREIRRVGDDRSYKVDFRLVAATNRDPRSLVAAGTMREDFYYRIRVYDITLPPLRDRREDIPSLVDHFIVAHAAASGKAVTGITEEALRYLTQHAWPGNVRELQHAIAHAFVSVTGDRLTLADLPLEIRDGPAPAIRKEPTPVPTTPENDGVAQIVETLRETQGNRTAAAKRLGISRVTLWKILRKHPAGPYPGRSASNAHPNAAPE